MFSLLLISCGFLSQADDSPPPETAEQVARLVRQLDDDQWARRQSAEETLVQMGPDVLRLLPRNPSRLSPEAQERLARVRDQLQQAFARRAVEASRVTLRGTMTLIRSDSPRIPTQVMPVC